MNTMECLLAAILLAVTTTFVFAYTTVWNDRREAEIASSQMNTLATALEHYRKNNTSSILVAFDTAGKKAVPMTLTDLKVSGYLRKGFPETNVWGQNYGLWYYQRKDKGIGILAAALGNSRTKDVAFGRGRLPRAAGRLQGGFWRPEADADGAARIKDGNALFGRGGMRYEMSDIGLTSDAIPIGSFGTLPGVSADEAAATDATGYLARLGEGSSVHPNPVLNGMATDLDLGDNPMLSVASFQLHTLSDGLMYFDGQAAKDVEALRKACAADVYTDESGNAVTPKGAEGLVIVDRSTGMWRCADKKLAEINDGRNALQIKTVAYVPYGEKLPAPVSCPAGTVASVYAIPVSSVPRTDASGTTVEEEPIRYFGTAVQEYADNGTDVFDFLNSIDISCPDGDCPGTDHHYSNLVIVACQHAGQE